MKRRYRTLEAGKARKMAEQPLDYMVSATVHEMPGILTPVKAVTLPPRPRLTGAAVDSVVFRQDPIKGPDGLACLERLIDGMCACAQLPVFARRHERLSDMVAEALHTVDDNIEASGRNPDGIRVRWAVPENIVLEVARCQIVTAITKVVQNAFEAFLDGSEHFRPGLITISAQAMDAETVQIAIEDTGMGIGAKDLDDIRQFIPGKATKKKQGIGFGLPIAKRHVQLHGGSVEIRSRENEGTCVTLVLPVKQPVTKP